MKDRVDIGRLAVRWWVVALAVLVPAVVGAQYPEAIVSAFCERDGYGDRLRATSWAGVAELVDWRLEPAWDHVFLITGYEIRGSAVWGDGVEVLVRYTVAAEVSGAEVAELPRIDTVPLRLSVESGTWRITGVPPAPRVFESMVDRERLRTSLAPENGEFVSHSKFVWRMFRDAGWNVSYHPAKGFLGSDAFAAVAEPHVGDLVAYLDRGVPYHVGIYEGEDRVASATVNAGIVRGRLNAFAGEVRYLRITSAAVVPSPIPVPEVTPAAVPPETGTKPEPTAVVRGGSQKKQPGSRKLRATATPTPRGGRTRGPKNKSAK